MEYQYAFQLFNDRSIDLGKKTTILFSNYDTNMSFIEDYINLIPIYQDMTFFQCFLKLNEKIKFPLDAMFANKSFELFGKKIYELNIPNLKNINEECVLLMLYSIACLKMDIEHNGDWTLQKYITSHRRIDKGKDLDEKFLTDLYKEVRNFVKSKQKLCMLL